MNFNKYQFSDIIELISEKIKIKELSESEYISTDNILPNLGGVISAESLPNANSCNKFLKNDVLFSNIRTYFKKVWLAEFSGGCSPDVLIMRSKDENILLNEYLFLLISSDDFINFTVASSKGTKMPRGDKNAMKTYIFEIPDIEYQKECIKNYFSFNKKIQLNTQINQTLEQIAQAIFKSWFVDFDPVQAKADALADGLTPAQAERAAMSVISGKNTAELDRLQTENPDQYHQLQQLATTFPSEFEQIEGFGEVPKGWGILKFKDFVTESKERVANRIGVEEFSVGNNGIMPRSEKYKKSLSKTPEKNKIIRNGYIVFGMGSHTLNWGIMQLGEGSVSPAYFVYKLDTNKVDYHYLNLFIHSYEADYQSLIKPTSRQGQSVDREMFLEKKIYVPDIQLLHIFIEKYHSIMKLKENLSNETNTLIKTRDELLPKLLNGEI